MVFYFLYIFWIYGDIYLQNIYNGYHISYITNLLQLSKIVDFFRNMWYYYRVYQIFLKKGIIWYNL